MEADPEPAQNVDMQLAGREGIERGATLSRPFGELPNLDASDNPNVLRNLPFFRLLHIIEQPGTGQSNPSLYSSRLMS